mmetsp:Transcript_37984/g.80447  ORF Transcript_37984/g.80447 Transcript_37984/m.80447 type:complete len:90 (+) Transcript_37984:114-383(+)
MIVFLTATVCRNYFSKVLPQDLEGEDCQCKAASEVCQHFCRWSLRNFSNPRTGRCPEMAHVFALRMIHKTLVTPSFALTIFKSTGLSAL